VNTLDRHASPLGTLVAPARRISDRAAVFLSVTQAVVGLALSQWGIRFDGFLDVHRAAAATAGSALVDQFVALPIAAGAGWLLLRLWRVRMSLGGVFRLFGVARIPLVAAAPLVLTMPTNLLEAPTGGMLFASIGALIGIVWMVAILTAGVRDAGSLRGGRLALVVGTVIIGAEFASKMALAAAG